MKTIFFIISIISIAISTNAQLPNTDIWLVDIVKTNDSISLKSPVNITKREGYDNQPVFSADGKYILYTSIREDKKAHIYKYILKRKKSKQFTFTTTSEYSPAFTPDGESVSVVMVEKDSVQRLWKFPINGGSPSLIMKTIDSIGYYCWITKDSLAMVKTSNPPVLEVANPNTERHKVLAHNVGRCMTTEADRLYYVQKPMDNYYYLYWSGAYVSQIPNEDFALLRTKQPLVFAGVQAKIVVISIYNRKQKTLLDLSAYGIKNITRIAINKDATRMAIVAE